MLYHILAVGDVVMEPGSAIWSGTCVPSRKWKAIDFTVVKRRECRRSGADPRQAERIYDAGATW